MLRLVAALAAFALVGVSFADDKKDDKKAPALSGKWVRESDNFELTFNFEKDNKLTLDVKASEVGLTILATITVDKDNKVMAEITDVKEKGNFPTKPEKGSKFSFKIKMDDKKATISDFESPDGDGAKAVVEGEYKKKTD